MLNGVLRLLTGFYGDKQRCHFFELVKFYQKPTKFDQFYAFQFQK